MLEPLLFLKLCALGGLLGMDATAALQAMVSRPLVVGTLVGWLLGDAATGLTVGGIIELLWVSGVPVGSLVPPDGTVAAALAATVAVRLGAASPHPGAAAAASSLGILLAVPAGWVGARAEILQRHWANRLSRQAEAQVAAGKLDGLGALVMAAMGMAWLRGALALGLCLLLMLKPSLWMLSNLPAAAVQALDWSFWTFWLLGLAVAVDHFWDRRGLKYAALLLLLLAVLGTRTWATQGTVLLLLIVAVHSLGLWRWWRALHGEATA